MKTEQDFKKMKITPMIIILTSMMIASFIIWKISQEAFQKRFRQNQEFKTVWKIFKLKKIQICDFYDWEIHLFSKILENVELFRQLENCQKEMHEKRIEKLQKKLKFLVDFVFLFCFVVFGFLVGFLLNNFE
jgi:uncharacterized membrane protein YbjE (DUF340 family)